MIYNDKSYKMIRNLKIKNKNNHRVWFLLFLLTLNITFPMGNNFLLKKEYKNKSVVKPVPGIITMGNTELVLTLLTT